MALSQPDPAILNPRDADALTSAWSEDHGTLTWQLNEAEIAFVPVELPQHARCVTI